MNRRRLSLSILAAAALALAAQAAEARKLRVAVEGAYPPFSEVAPDGSIKGFDIDIAKALCAQIKAECTLVKLDFDGMIPALQSRKVDAIVASMAITEERKKQVAFTDKYYNTPARFVVRAGSPITISPEGLKGKRIGVQRSTTHDRFLSATFKQSEVVRYTKQDEVFLDLASGRIDATLQDSVAADFGFLKTPQGKGFAFAGPSYNDAAIFGEGSGIAIRKADTALQAELNAAIKAIRADGRYKAIEAKYFAFDVYGDASK
ncbi:MAG TPA: ABC transporter substrate-binding protein [Methylibium sp.]|uniref:ABC transporter substrate-binding protein n=1 Tax=Methylibium sp. TaxID=2067992 RepID=UPI002DB967CA|nr:ABC transporter substrate-binding protein [Methylibium sp.]HEU4457613.1 ABC transporter substrate-binding protein [Methylibium sp.]